MKFTEKEFNVINYDDCITNITSSIEKYYGRFYNSITPTYKTNKIIDSYLDNKEYQNVLIFLYDAMGDAILKKNLKENSFLRSNQVGVSKSTYPPTTANCTISWQTGLNPCKTGWLGWSTCFNEQNICIDNFPNVEVGTQKQIETKDLAWKLLPYRTLGERIEEASNGEVKYYNIHCVIKGEGEKKLRGYIRKIEKLCKEPGKKFFYCYWTNPDAIMHELGTTHNKVKKNLLDIDAVMAHFNKHVSNTFAICSADHGQIDVNGIELYKYEDVTKMLYRPYTCDSRTPFFFVKDEYKEEFPIVFNKYFSEYYYLKSKEEVIENGIFGPEEGCEMFYKILGDYIGFAKSNYYFIQFVDGHRFKGHHAGLCEDELNIPIIIIDK